MYWHYVRHNVWPSEWAKMGQGEKIILRAFMLQEIEAEHTEKEKIDAMVRDMKKGGA